MNIPGLKNEIVVSNGIVVWLDADDVAVDFHRFFNAHLRQNGYKVALDFIPQKYSYLDVMSQSQFNAMFSSLGSHWPRDLEAFSGAAEFTRRLKELGCRVIIITSIDGHQLPERIKNLQEHQIYFDEIYATKGRNKSEYAKELLPRYVSARGAPVLNILVDDFAKNVLDFVEQVPRAVKGITMDIGYSKDWLKKAEGNRKISGRSRTPQELYEETLRCIAKLLIRRPKIKVVRRRKKGLTSKKK